MGTKVHKAVSWEDYGEDAPSVGNLDIPLPPITMPSYELPEVTPMSTAMPNIQIPNMQATQLPAPDYSQLQPLQSQLPNYSQQQPLIDYSSQIGDLGQQRIQQGLKSLQELVFKPQYAQERERISSRGLVGAGPENEILSDLSREQNVRATDYISEEQGKISQQQLQERQSIRDLQEERQRTQIGHQFQDLQSLRDLQEDRQGMQMEQTFQAALAQGDLDQARQIHDQQTKLDIASLRQQNKAMELDIEKFNYSQVWDHFTASQQKFEDEIMAHRAVLEEQGINIDMHLADIETAKWISNGLIGSDYKGQDYLDALKDQLIEAGLGEFYVFEDTSQEAKAGDNLSHLSTEGKDVSRNRLMSAEKGVKVFREDFYAAGGNIGALNEGQGSRQYYYLGDSAWVEDPYTTSGVKLLTKIR